MNGFEGLQELKSQLAKEGAKDANNYNVIIELKSETVIGAGKGVSGGVNLDLVRDDNGFHYIKATSLKGLVREQMEWFNELEDGILTGLIDILLGKFDAESRENKTGKLKFWDLETSNKSNKDTNEITRYSTAVDEKTGIAKKGSLRSYNAIREGAKFKGKITVEEKLTDEEERLLVSSIKAIKHLGSFRTRGKGAVKCKLQKVNKTVDLGEDMNKTIKFSIKLLQNVIINDISGSSAMQKALDFIPGSSVRGEFVSKYKLRHRDDFSQEKLEQILDNVIFSNLYIQKDDLDFIPTPQGFIADKHQIKAKNFDRVLNSLVYDFDKNDQDADDKIQGQAIAGKCAYFTSGSDSVDDDKNKLTSVDFESTNRIALNTNSKHGNRVFHTQSIKKGQEFWGEITFPEELKNELTAIITEGNILNFGQAKTAGFGACEVLEVSAESENNMQNDSQNALENSQNAEVSNELLIYCQSDIISLDSQGKCISHISPKLLEEKLGISNVILEKSILSQKVNGGYNNTYRSGYPRYTQIMAGSCFKYSFEGSLDSAKVAELESLRIGLRKQDGYGKVLLNPSFLFDGSLIISSQS